MTDWTKRLKFDQIFQQLKLVELVQTQVICHSPNQSTEGTAVLMTFNIPKDILAAAPANPRTRSVDDSGRRRKRMDGNLEDNNFVVSGDYSRKAFSVPTTTMDDLERTTSDPVCKETDDLQMCRLKRMRPESLNCNDNAKRWIIGMSSLTSSLSSS